MNPAKSFPIDQSYINLAIVAVKEQYKKEQQLHSAQHNDNVLNSYEEIYGTKSAINVKDIFQSCEGKNKQVLVFGRAGIGKSTFCRYIAYQWAKDSYWSQYELLALIPLRGLTTNRYPPLAPGQNYSLIDLVKKEVFSYELSEKEEELLKKQFDTKKTLWILDGYDEIIQNVPSHLECLFKHLLHTPHHILTSRPYLNTLSYKVQMKITGFTDENIVQYVRQFFYQMKDELDDATMKSQTLVKFLKSNPSIWGVAHIPVNLELICSLCSNQDWSETEQLSITTLYSMITEWLCRRYLEKQNNQILQLSKDEIYQRCQKELTFLENLAFTAMENNTIIIRPSLLEKALRKANVTTQEYLDILNIGILKSFTKQGIGNQIEINKDHYFIHLSFQEYFAAQYLINILKESSTEKVVEFIQYQKYNQRYALVFTFVAGLLSKSDDTMCLNIFWDNILGEPLDLVGLRHMELVIICLEETSTEANFARRDELLQWITKCIEYSLLTKKKIVPQHLSQSLRRAQSVVCEKTMINMMIALLKQNEADIKVEILFFICSLSISNAPARLINVIDTLLSDGDDQVKIHACEAIRTIGQKAATVEVLNKLVRSLGDKRKSVRSAVCYTLREIGERTMTTAMIIKLVNMLGNEDFSVSANARFLLDNMVEKMSTPEVINKLVSALQDPNAHARHNTYDFILRIAHKIATTEMISKLVDLLDAERKDVRQNACHILATMSEKAATSEVTNKLVSTALKDQSFLVRLCACSALEHISGEMASIEALTKLLSAIRDKNFDVRQSACFALEQIGQKAATTEVISALKSAAEDKNEYVRASACAALVNMREKLEITETTSILSTALRDENEYVRVSACEVIGKMIGRAATTEVLMELKSALGDKSSNVKHNACIALGSMGETAATTEIIDALMNVIEDESGDIRASACEAIGRIGEKAATTKVISKLVSFLEDESANVRAAACCALQEMRERASTPEVIRKLASALEDQNAHVRQRACCALWQWSGKVEISEVIDNLVSALGDESERVRYFACSALQNMIEQTAASEMINKLIDTLEDDRVYVRENVCFLLGQMGEKAATTEVIDKLMNALDDKSSSVRARACWALHRASEKVVMTKVIGKIVNAMVDEDSNVSTNACLVLQKMSEKITTSEIISKLIIPLNGNNLNVSHNAAELIGNSLNSSGMISELGPSKILELCLPKFGSVCLKNVSEEQLIQLFLADKISDWLPAIMKLTLVRETAVTASEEKIVVYGRKEPLELPISGLERQQLVEAFRDQGKNLHLFL